MPKPFPPWHLHFNKKARKSQELNMKKKKKTFAKVARFMLGSAVVGFNALLLFSWLDVIANNMSPSPEYHPLNIINLFFNR